MLQVPTAHQISLDPPTPGPSVASRLRRQESGVRTQQPGESGFLKLAACRTVTDTTSTGETETISFWLERYFLGCDDEIPGVCCLSRTCSYASRLARRRVTAIRKKGLAWGSMVRL